MIQNYNINRNTNSNDGCGGCCIFFLLAPIWIAIGGFILHAANILSAILPYLAVAAVIGLVGYGVVYLKRR
jgi:hypothetical protein